MLEAQVDEKEVLLHQVINKADAAEFIRDHLLNLRDVALCAEWQEIVYYIDMVVVEAVREVNLNA